jgi:hypothetical protein
MALALMNTALALMNTAPLNIHQMRKSLDALNELQSTIRKTLNTIISQGILFETIVVQQQNSKLVHGISR